MDKKSIGARLREARRKKGLTQVALAEIVNKEPSYISDIERGKKFPSMSLFIQLINALDISADFILRGELHSGKSYLYNDLAQKLDPLTPQQRENACAMLDAYLKTLK